MLSWRFDKFEHAFPERADTTRSEAQASDVGELLEGVRQLLSKLEDSGLKRRLGLRLLHGPPPKWRRKNYSSQVAQCTFQLLAHLSFLSS